MEMSLLSPGNGRPLQSRGKYLLDDGDQLWPVVDGIAYLRPNEETREAVVTLLQQERAEEALLLLLTEQDRFSPTAPPGREALRELLRRRDTIRLREAMDLLNYGAVGDYFAYRWCAPTFVSGLRLLEMSTPAAAGQAVVEYACGIGQYLRELERMGRATVGVDIVFSKLWLARHLLGVRGPLICGDVERAQLLPSGEARTVFCHDAFYFFAEKESALRNLRSVAGAAGTVAIGHVHTHHEAHQAGFPEDYGRYAAMTTAEVMDDGSLAESWYGAGAVRAADGATLSIALLEGERYEKEAGLRFSAATATLALNPLLGAEGVAWPSEGWREEFDGDWREPCTGYHPRTLVEQPEFSRLSGAGPEAIAGLPPATRERLYRNRTLINLPERW